MMQSLFGHVAGMISARLETFRTHRSLLERRADTQDAVWKGIADNLKEIFHVATVSGVDIIRTCWQERVMFFGNRDQSG